MNTTNLPSLSYTPVSPQFGAELDNDIQLVQMTDAEIGQLEQLAAERGVVIARNQQMSNEEQAAFAHRLGEPLTTPINKGDVPQELIVISANENSRRVAGTTWHSDVSSEAIPPGLSMLRMEVTPTSGGDTLFADMMQAFETLSPAVQKLALDLTARHDPKGHYLYLSGAKRLDELPSAMHPVVRTHPLTGKNALYVNEGFTGAINDMSRIESDRLLRMFYDHIAYNVAAQIRVHWEPNTVVFWDNRVVQHHAAFDYYPQARRAFRATIRGEAPVPASS